MKIIRAVICALAALLVSSTATALSFGKSEKIRFITNIEAKGPNGETLYLGHKVTFDYFLAGYAVHDDGYVVGIHGDSSRYFPLPMHDRIADMQQRGLMPSPLPSYELFWTDYLWGNLLWVGLVCAAIWIPLSFMWQNRKNKVPRAVGTDVQGAPDPSTLAIRAHMHRHLASPPSLPITFKSKTFLSIGSNDIAITKDGFAFASATGLNDLTYWPDVSGFSLQQVSGKPMAGWRYSQDFRGLPLAEVLARTDGLTQLAAFGPFNQQTPEEVIGLLNAIWLMRRDSTPVYTPAGLPK